MSDTTTIIIITVTVCGFFVVAGVIALIVLLSLANDPTCCLGCRCYQDRHHPADPGLIESAQRLRRNSMAHRGMPPDPFREAFTASLSQQQPPYSNLTPERGPRLTPATTPPLSPVDHMHPNFNHHDPVFVSPRFTERDGSMMTVTRVGTGTGYSPHRRSPSSSGQILHSPRRNSSPGPGPISPSREYVMRRSPSPGQILRSPQRSPSPGPGPISPSREYMMRRSPSPGQIIRSPRRSSSPGVIQPSREYVMRRSPSPGPILPSREYVMLKSLTPSPRHRSPSHFPYRSPVGTSPPLVVLPFPAEEVTVEMGRIYRTDLTMPPPLVFANHSYNSLSYDELAGMMEEDMDGDESGEIASEVHDAFHSIKQAEQVGGRKGVSFDDQHLQPLPSPSSSRPHTPEPLMVLQSPFSPPVLVLPPQPSHPMIVPPSPPVIPPPLLGRGRGSSSLPTTTTMMTTGSEVEARVETKSESEFTSPIASPSHVTRLISPISDSSEDSPGNGEMKGSGPEAGVVWHAVEKGEDDGRMGGRGGSSLPGLQLVTEKENIDLNESCEIKSNNNNSNDHKNDSITTTTTDNNINKDEKSDIVMNNNDSSTIVKDDGKNDIKLTEAISESPVVTGPVVDPSHLTLDTLSAVVKGVQGTGSDLPHNTPGLGSTDPLAVPAHVSVISLPLAPLTTEASHPMSPVVKTLFK